MTVISKSRRIQLLSLKKYGSMLPCRLAVRLMEICGTHTMAIARSGLKKYPSG